MKEENKGVYTYVAQWPVFSLAWSARRDKPRRIAIGSFIEDYANKFEIVRFSPEASPNLTADAQLLIDHPYAPTNLMFFPSDHQDDATSHPDLLATSGDFLRLWEIHDDDRVELKSLLDGNKTSEFSAAVTSFDWSTHDMRKIVTCSVDTTCTVWDAEAGFVETQLVAHDKEVYDVSWGGSNVFASASGDGSVRVFDLRDKERSTIIYENESPLLRVEWNKFDPRFMATVGMDSRKVVVLDIRLPTMPLLELDRHYGSVNGVTWSPKSGRYLCSVGDDFRAMIWDALGRDFRSDGGGDVEPDMWYRSTAEINQVRWSPVDSDWIAISFLNKLQLLKV